MISPASNTLATEKHKTFVKYRKGKPESERCQPQKNVEIKKIERYLWV